MTSGRAADLTMVLPTYNERDRLGELVDALFAGASRAGIDLEVVVVDDHSPDGGLQKTRNASSKIARSCWR